YLANSGKLVWTQTNGAVTFAQQLRFADAIGSSALVNISDGSFTQSAGSPAYVGNGGSATMNISGNANVSLRALSLAYVNGVTGSINITGGTFAAGSAANSYIGGEGAAATGVFTQSAGTATFAGQTLFANQTNSFATVNLSGGSLRFTNANPTYVGYL